MASAGVVVTRVLEEGVLAPDGFHSRALHRSQGSILIYLAVGGTVVPMRVLESDSIASVKLRIQSCKGFVVKKQKLVFEGRELARNDCLVKDYGVADGNVLHLVLRLSDLRFITVKTDCGKVFEFHVEKSRSVGYVKQQVAKRGRGFLDHGAQALTCDGEELDDQKRIDDICRDNDAVIRLLVKKTAKVRAWPVEKEFEVSIEAPGEVVAGRAEVDVGRLSLGEENHLVGKNVVDLEACLEPVKVNDKIELSNVAKDFIHSAAAGLQGKHFPVRSSEGSGGAYFMRDASGLSFVGVFKPTDEEPMAVNNPQGLPLSEDGEGLKRGTKVGEGALREVAAYILDHPVGGPRACSGDEVGFSGVPPTVMVKCLHEGFYHPDGFDCSVENAKMGSLQMFVKNQGSCEDMGPRDFPVGEVHKIAVLDMRLANADRHAGNILFSKGADGRIELIPIDHGYCLPESVSLYSPPSHDFNLTVITLILINMRLVYGKMTYAKSFSCILLLHLRYFVRANGNEGNSVERCWLS